MNEFLETEYNPDVLECIANLSNDEVFTPPKIANAMLDLFPKELFCNPNTKFLDPCCKSGVFLREIAKRLLKGLKEQIPDLQERIDHIFKNQIYGISLTNLTSLLSRRSVYCAKKANSKYSVTEFTNDDGNIFFSEQNHFWINGKCLHCGISETSFNAQFTDKSEKHAYQFIHEKLPGEIENMKFDVIIGNPPYQMKVNETGKGLGAIPIYQNFVKQALKLKPSYLVMITPARWYAGGVGLDLFRKDMLSSKNIKYLYDFTDSNDCFPGVDINGGVSYFLYDRNYQGPCNYTNLTNGKETHSIRKLDEFEIFLRRNEAVSIIHKVLEKKEKKLSDEGGCSPQTPYGLLSSYVGNEKRYNSTDYEVLSSKGWIYAPKESVTKGLDSIKKFKPMISKLSCEHAGNPDKNGMYRVLSRMEILKPNQICTQSYLTICNTDNFKEAVNVSNYLKTKFVRFLILQTLVGMNISIMNFRFVPWLDFSQTWTDAQLYKKYNLTQEEIEFIESMIRPMP